MADGVTFTSVFKLGQVLFGKRRACQRKVAVADFAGVCSGDIYVLESRDADLLEAVLSNPDPKKAKEVLQVEEELFEKAYGYIRQYY